MAALPTFLYTFAAEWLDILWIPLALLVVHAGQRIKAVFFILICVATLRLQMEIMQSLGYAGGFTGFFEMSSFHRGLITYSVFIAAYLLLSYFSPYTKGPIYLAASLSIFFMAFVTSSFFMVI